MQVKAVEELESAPEGMSHFEFDSYHMGSDVGNGADMLIMYGEFERNPYIIICNKTTGERTRVWLDIEPKDPIKGYWHMGRYDPDYWHTTEKTIPVVERSKAGNV